MRQLIYVSSAAAVTGCCATEMQTILETARIFNRAHDIAGLLLYRHFNFMQVLEGPQAAVEDLFFKHIVNDRRHCNILLLRNEEVVKPSFPHWAMSFDAVGMTAVASDIPGLLAFDQWVPHRDPAAFKPGDAELLLLQFWTSWYSPTLHGREAPVPAPPALMNGGFFMQRGTTRRLLASGGVVSSK